MPTPAVDALLQAIAQRRLLIRANMVNRAIHELLDVNLDEAQRLTQQLEEAGYASTHKGDWVRG